MKVFAKSRVSNVLSFGEWRFRYRLIVLYYFTVHVFHCTGDVPNDRSSIITMATKRSNLIRVFGGRARSTYIWLPRATCSHKMILGLQNAERAKTL